MSGGRYKRYHPPKYQRHELARIETKLWEKIRNVDRPVIQEFQGGFLNTRDQIEEDQQSSSDNGDTVSGMEVQVVDWSKYAGCRSIQYI